MTRPSFALRRFLHDKLVDRLTEEKVVDKRTIDNLANRYGDECRAHAVTKASLAKMDKAYDELADRLKRAEDTRAYIDNWRQGRSS